jgi:hypothetical protein
VLVVVSFIDDLDTIFKFDRSQKSKPIETADELAKVRKTGFSVSPKWRLTLQVSI